MHTQHNATYECILVEIGDHVLSDAFWSTTKHLCDLNKRQRRNSSIPLHYAHSSIMQLYNCLRVLYQESALNLKPTVSLNSTKKWCAVLE